MSDVWWQRATTSARVSAVFVISIAFSIVFFTVGPYGDVQAAGGIVDDDFGSNAEGVLAAVEALGSAGQAAYQTFLLGDLLYALLQGVWMAGFLIIGMRQWQKLPRWLPLIPVAATLFDWLENMALLTLLRSPSTGIAWVAVVAMHLKLVLVVLSILAVVAVLGWWLSHPVQRHPRQPRQPRPTRTRAPNVPEDADPGRGQHAQRKTRER